MIHSSLSEGKYPKTEICVVRVNCTIVKSGICFTIQICILHQSADREGMIRLPKNST